jgi:hypothetical protein
MTTPIYNKRGQEVGQYNPASKIYFTIRDAKKSEIFMIPKYLGRVAIDIDILKQLMRAGCEMIDMLILNYKPNAFHAKIKLIDFLNNSEEIHYDKKIEHFGNKVSTMYSPQRRLLFSVEQIEVKRP